MLESRPDGRAQFDDANDLQAPPQIVAQAAPPLSEEQKSELAS